MAGEKVFTKTPPEGWVRDDSKVPGIGTDSDGIKEWAGWGFASKDWWASTAGNQRRVEWMNASGTVMIADPDEWDDAGHVQGLFNVYMTTSDISLAGQTAESLVLTFDSSWRPEAFDDGEPSFPVDADGNKINNQTGIVTLTYDNGSPIELIHWDSDSSGPYYKADGDYINEAVVVPLGKPIGRGQAEVDLRHGETRPTIGGGPLDNIAIGVPPFVSGIVSDGVSFTTRISEALGKSVNDALPIKVELDGKTVTGVEITREDERVFVKYNQAPEIFPPNSKHTVQITFTSNEGKQIVDTAEFVAPSYTTALRHTHDGDRDDHGKGLPNGR